MDTLGTRIFLAHKALESQLGHNVSLEEYGRLIAREEGRKGPRGAVRPYSGGNVLRWEKNEKRPSLEAITAIAKLAGMRPGFVAFGELPQYTAGAESREPAPLPNEALEPIVTTRRAERAERAQSHSGAASGVSRRGMRNR